MKIIEKTFLLFAITGLVFASPAFAAVGPEVIQRQQQQDIEAQMRAQEVQSIAAQSPYATGEIDAEKAAAASAVPTGRCVEIKQIAFAGNTILSDRAVRRITAVYEGRCLRVDEINVMLNDITNAYIERGHATSRAFMEMPQTRLNDGILDIHIIEGEIGRIESLSAGERATAFPWLRGEILNIRDIEQGLDQMNRLGANKASMDIKATPSHDGVSDIIITNEPQGNTALGATLDNSGTDSTGEWRAGASFSQDNLLGLNDNISLFLNHSIVPDFDNRLSRSAMAGFSIPLGYWTFSNNFSYSQYKTSFPMPVSGDRFFSLGDSITNTFAIDRMLWRGQTYKLAATAGLTYKNNDNRMRVYDLETRNDASSRSLSLVSFDLPLTLYFPKGMLYIKPGAAQGIRAFGAADDRDSPYAQRAQYIAARLYAYTGWQFQYFNVSSALDGQWSNDELFSTESFYLGGQSSIRGFRNDSTMGDSGFNLRNDFDLKLGGIFATENRWVRAFTPGIFADFGIVFPNGVRRDNGAMSGAGAKLGFKYWLIDASAAYARVIAKEDWMNEDYSVYLYLGISGRF
jgi:hemolysin activation/secretion protein